jgi:hypothetical protein
MDCIELHKLTVLPADAAEKQRFYVQQVVRKPQRVMIRQYMSRVGVLNDYIAHLPSIFYSLEGGSLHGERQRDFWRRRTRQYHPRFDATDVAESVQPHALYSPGIASRAFAGFGEH